MGINSKIIEALNEECNQDSIMKKLLTELIQFELEDKGRWKDPYNSIVLKYAKILEENNEDK